MVSRNHVQVHGRGPPVRARTFLARHSTRRLDKPFRVADVRARCDALLAGRVS